MNMPLIVSLAFLLFCLYMFWHALVNYRMAKASKGWVSTTGKLIEVQLWGKRRVDGKMVNCQNLSIKFSYDVNAQNFTSSRACFYTLHYPETTDFVKGHPQGSVINIYYNPKDPAQSVIVPGLHPEKPLSEILLASIGVALGLAAFVGTFTGQFK